MASDTIEPPVLRLAPVEILAPAKINLALHVTGRRADGYHTLSSLVAFAGIGDRIELSPAGTDRLDMTGPFAAALSDSLAEGAPNILARTLALARGVARLQGHEIPPLALKLDKRLPVAAGIGGGSADAAALLRALADAYPGLEAPFAEASLELGADVPMCLAARAARVSGIGETVEPLPAFPAVPAVLVNPGVPVSTPLVFSRLSRRDNPPMPDLPALTDLGILLDILQATRNDMEDAATAIAPAIGEARRALIEAGALLSRMSGSGATVFAVFPDDAAAAKAAAAIRQAHPHWWVEPTRLGNGGGRA
ncbi:4-(cytidine 5'-diphospho)-2-C-methyl-D-erythritol kinase [Aureimonas psammosilenae]|uniref:4-(cytidine 5'-diphospho)-2-C-methyl-D-erythritol kinase n=1 Tax=Aureimonas psammosilenae TaxID=2495496 RepID=UPI001260F9E9|nr:4-(cytidine 5'-diphospho)-2-C-methyl-D-erythritol kinase [Aureimonas psammosilenae]